MKKIDALEIWKKISRDKICTEASLFYQSNAGDKADILQKGSANFDKNVTSNKEEKGCYRAAYYMSSDGYMDMHIKQNKASCLRYLTKLPKNTDVLFVDFGCGPMTSGVVFAQLMSQIQPNYKNFSTYIGIDASRNMCAFSEVINSKFELFCDEKFKILHSSSLDLPNIELDVSTLVLSISFAFSDETFKPRQGETAITVAEAWHSFFVAATDCLETRIIYHNPLDGNFHSNWEKFRQHLSTLGKSANVVYSGGEIENCNWGGHRPSAMAMITGSKRQ